MTSPLKNYLAHAQTVSAEYAAHAAAAVTSSSLYKQAETKLAPICHKIEAIVRPFLSYDVVKTKAQGALKAKVLPFSTPAEWKNELAALNEKCAMQKGLKHLLEKELKKIISQLDNVEKATISNKGSPTSKSNCASLKVQKETKQKQLDQLTKSLDEAQKKISDHNKKFYTDNLPSQVAGMVGTVSNLIVPGSGIGIGLASTAAISVLRHQTSDAIAEKTKDKDYAAQTQAKAYNRTMSFAATTVALLAYNFFAKPYVNETAFQAFQYLAQAHQSVGLNHTITQI